MASHQTGFGVAKKNQMNEICRIGEAAGPLTLLISNEGTSNIVISAFKKSDGSRVAFDDETAVTGHAIGGMAAGNNSDLNFTGTIAHTPIVPGSVTITPTAGGSTVNAVDTNGDGDLWSVETTPELCGTVDYITGAVILRYPATHPPNTGAITCSFSYASAALKPHAKLSKRLGNLPPTETYIIKAAARKSTGAAKIKIDAFITY